MLLESEYEYFLTWLVAQGVMTTSNWINLRPYDETSGYIGGIPITLPAGKSTKTTFL